MVSNSYVDFRRNVRTSFLANVLHQSAYDDPVSAAQDVRASSAVSCAAKQARRFRSLDLIAQPETERLGGSKRVVGAD